MHVEKFSQLNTSSLLSQVETWQVEAWRETGSPRRVTGLTCQNEATQSLPKVMAAYLV